MTLILNLLNVLLRVNKKIRDGVLHLTTDMVAFRESNSE